MATSKDDQLPTRPSRRARILGFDDRTPFAVLDREHQSLRQGLSRLRRAVAGQASAADLCDQIEAVRWSLAGHFAFEENFGSLHYLRGAWPSLWPQLDELTDEHGEILATLDRLMEGLEKALSPAEVRATMSSLVERLADHELKQHSLGRRALLEDPSRPARSWLQPTPPSALRSPPR